MEIKDLRNTYRAPQAKVVEIIVCQGILSESNEQNEKLDYVDRSNDIW